MSWARFRQVTVLFSAAAVALAANVPAHAAGPPPPGYLPPGEYLQASTFASLHTVINGTLNVDVSVGDNIATQNPKDGPASTSEQTILNVSLNDFSDNINLQGCFLISPGDFMASSDLTTMTLITKILDSTPTCFFFNTIPSGTVVSMQWLGTGPIAKSRDDAHFSCLAFTQETQRTNANNVATVSGTLSGLGIDPLSNQPGFMDAGSSDVHVSGIADQTCPPGGGFGKGAGPGPQPAGNFEFINNEASAIFQSSDFTQFVQVVASRDVEIANPQGGGTVASAARTNASGTRTNAGPVPTETAQVEIRITDFNTFTFENACYLVAPGAFQINGISSAALHVFLDGTQTPCPHSFDQQNVPLPLTVNASWTGSGPSAPTRDDGQFGCAAYNSQSTSLGNNVTASSKFTLPERFPNQEFDSGPDLSGLGASDLKVHASGVDPDVCIFRG